MRPRYQKKLLQTMKITMQKPLETMPLVGYSASVTATSVTGFDSPLPKADAPPQLIGSAVFLRPLHSIAPCLGGGVRGASCPPVPLARSVNPHIAALFAFDSANGGFIQAKGAQL
jgi:hypothetical protein